MQVVKPLWSMLRVLVEEPGGGNQVRRIAGGPSPKSAAQDDSSNKGSTFIRTNWNNSLPGCVTDYSYIGEIVYAVILSPFGRRISRDTSDIHEVVKLFDPCPDFWWKGQESAFKTDASREVLRRKARLRMTVLIKPQHS